jgi:2-oxoglutarate dehydrogenase E2 component (dihydrolipoamide succinyltransferase)
VSLELTVPELGESITEVEIGDWLKAEGARVEKDEPVVALESAKATVELPAPEAGTISRVLKQKGQVAHIGEAIAYIETDGQSKTTDKGQKQEAKEKPAAKSAPQPAAQKSERKSEPAARASESRAAGMKPAVKRAEALEEAPKPRQEATPSAAPARQTSFSPSPPTSPPAPESEGKESTPAGEEEVVPMSRLRRTVAERLVAAQHNAALLTTFNEIDMGNVIALRQEHGDAFQQKYNVKLGFMSFFVKAAVEALKEVPVVNAAVRDANIVYHNFFDIGVAIGSGKGLVVPVLWHAERMSFAEIEVAIGDFARRAKENKLKIEELEGGTFTISNGGVYGSLLSTPIVNPPQSGVLGLHAIQERPVARAGNVVIRPMMYVALTYDHRIVDGREAVTFLKRIKDLIENPARLLIEM